MREPEIKASTVTIIRKTTSLNPTTPRRLRVVFVPTEDEKIWIASLVFRAAIVDTGLKALYALSALWSIIPPL
jgi:hypothetical protein